ncbi:hypothetical protein [Niabella drilacis]|uniref:Outer membrane protein beta-barrel domain-containing protein n=1 Tax=Niabella drilacis (strain DSM 25811 / CCM 8410 / CCUG 62505 / LMG 26954 / E90) TaxID=1285928 RepID=A0A1G6TWL0_NIADE|nr:hypothetical protein [Niabella drilacis]SDD33488.1 hypothetical protein SAMN04487894_10862 [Niabella drilacis]
MKKLLFPAFCLLGLSLFSFNARAQTELQKNSIGISPGVQWIDGMGARPSLHISYEHRISFYSGIETGVSYASLVAAATTGGTDLKPKKTYYHLFTLPLLYRLHTKIIDVAAGPSLNIQTSLPPGSKTAALSQGMKKDPGQPALGYLLKASKPVRLNKRLTLDPQAGIYGNQYLKQPQWTTGIGLKYRF